jgi:hypothetical protein
LLRPKQALSAEYELLLLWGKVREGVEGIALRSGKSAKKGERRKEEGTHLLPGDEAAPRVMVRRVAEPGTDTAVKVEVVGSAMAENERASWAWEARRTVRE